jgi:hypothetical protein
LGILLLLVRIWWGKHHHHHLSHQGGNLQFTGPRFETTTRPDPWVLGRRTGQDARQEGTDTGPVGRRGS